MAYYITLIRIIFCFVLPISGELLKVHVEITNKTNEIRETEESIVVLLRKIAAKLALEEFSEDMRNRTNHLLTELQSIVVGAQMTNSVMMFVLVSSRDGLEAVQTMYTTRRLHDVVQQLFGCLAVGRRSCG